MSEEKTSKIYTFLVRIGIHDPDTGYKYSAEDHKEYIEDRLDLWDADVEVSLVKEPE